MPLKYYVPISVAFFALVVTLVNHYGIPVLPFAVITIAAETALGFLAEDHRIAHRVSRFVSALKPDQHDDPHHAR